MRNQNRIVEYAIGKDHAGEVVRRPAIVVNDWGSGVHPNIQVFLDGSNDARYGFTSEECARGTAWRTSVDEGEGVGEWRWPPRT